MHGVFNGLFDPAKVDSDALGKLIEDYGRTLLSKEYIIEKEGEYPTSLWYCITTLYGVHDLCKNIHIQSGFTVCPTTSPSNCSNLH